MALEELVGQEVTGESGRVYNILRKQEGQGNPVHHREAVVDFGNFITNEAIARLISVSDKKPYFIKELRKRSKEYKFFKDLGPIVNNHPNFVPLVDEININDKKLMVFPYLHDRNGETGTLTTELCKDFVGEKTLITQEWMKARVGFTIANVLSLLNMHGYGWFDLKPQNVMVADVFEGMFRMPPHIKLIDFEGAAKGERDITGELMFDTSQRMPFTIRYIAPERYLDPKIITSKCDVYSLGVIMYQLYHGMIDYRSGSGVIKYFNEIGLFGTECAEDHEEFLDENFWREHHVLTPDDVYKSQAIPNEMKMVIAGCLRINPRKRFTTSVVADEFLRIMHRLGNNLTDEEVDYIDNYYQNKDVVILHK
jgi:serine/threonine protein kinase